MIKPLFLILFTCYFVSIASAQSTGSDEFGNKYAIDSTHSPRKAAIQSLIVPGLGQIYNHQVWKAPLIYTGLGLLVAAWINDQHYYKQFISVAILVRMGSIPSPTSRYYPLYQKYKIAYARFSGSTVDELTAIAASSQRGRNLSAFGIAGLWGLNVIDAYIKAKFIKSYTMDNNLSFKITPGFIDTGNMYAVNNEPLTPCLKITLIIN
jgi:hypothetical protein